MIVEHDETQNGSVWYVLNKYHIRFENEMEMIIWCNSQFGNMDRLLHIRHFNKGWNFDRDTFMFRREEDVTLFLLAWSDV
jgi:hypothetical protein